MVQKIHPVRSASCRLVWNLKFAGIVNVSVYDPRIKRIYVLWRFLVEGKGGLQ